MKSEKEKAREVLKKRRLAAKHIKERKDGKPIDPMADIGTLDLDVDPRDPASTDEKEREIARGALPAGLMIKRR